MVLRLAEDMLLNIVEQMQEHLSYTFSCFYVSFHFQDLNNNSPYILPYNSQDVSSENLVLDQLIILLLIIFIRSPHLPS